MMSTNHQAISSSVWCTLNTCCRYFVENILEETDFPHEWFFKEDEGPHGTIYLVPSSAEDAAANFTSGSGKVTLVGTQHVRAIQVLGSSAEPVKNVAVANITITHTAVSYLERYEIPSGGDWAITRNGAIFLDGVVGAAITGCVFDQIDGNGVFMSRHVRNSSVTGSKFWAIGESAVLVAGAAGHHRTNQANSTDYPAFNLISQNHVDTLGVRPPPPPPPPPSSSSSLVASQELTFLL